MIIHTRYDYNGMQAAIVELLTWLTVLIAMVFVTYQIFKMKKQRLEREETMFYQIQQNI